VKVQLPHIRNLSSRWRWVVSSCLTCITSS